MFWNFNSFPLVLVQPETICIYYSSFIVSVLSSCLSELEGKYLRADECSDRERIEARIGIEVDRNFIFFSRGKINQLPYMFGDVVVFENPT